MQLDHAPRRLFTAPEVIRMVETGVLSENEHVELIEGDLVMVPPQGPVHGNRIAEINMLLTPRYAGHANVRVQLPLDVDLHSMPEPDFATAVPTPGRHPRGEDTWLVIEVAKTSQALDREKAKLYARAGAPIYWLVDLAARRIVEHTDPDGAREYRSIRLYTPSDTIALPRLDERIPVVTVLGPEE